MKPARFVLVSCLAMTLAACGDDENVSDKTPDGAQGPDGGPLPDATPAGCTCAVVGSDFMNPVGVLSVLELPARTVQTNVAPAAISNDPVVRAFGDKVYVVNRFGANNVTVLQKDTWAVVDQFSTGADTNPQDIAVVGQKGYVPLYGIPGVQVWNLTDTSAGPAATIDLSPYLDGGGDGATPEAAGIAVMGARAFVPLQHLDGSFAPRRNGTVVVIDTATDTVTGTFSLTSENPLSAPAPLGAGLGVATIPDFGDPTASGCVETITTGATPGAGGCFATNADLGGFVTSFVEVPGGAVYAAVSRADFTASVRVVSPNGQVEPDALTPAGQTPTDLGTCAATGQLVVSDTAAGGLRVYDLGTGQEATTAPIDIGLPPVYTGGIACW